jgi:hypothetical protein
MIPRHSIVPLVLLCSMLVPAAAFASPASEVVEQLFKLVVKKAGKEAAQEILERGGAIVVREALEAAAREGGQELAERVAREVIEHGVPAAHALRNAPARAFRFLDNTPLPLRKSAMHVLSRQGDEVLELTAKYGDDVAEQIVRHPGVGQKVVGQLGREGADILKRCDEDLAIRLARQSDDIAKLPPDARKSVLESIQHNAGKALDFLERHPNLLKNATIAGTTLGGIAMLRDHVFGDPDTNPPGGFGGQIVDALKNLLTWPVIIVSSLFGLALAASIYRRFAPRRQPTPVVSNQAVTVPAIENLNRSKQ